MDALECIMSRRSVRKFSDREVDNETLRKIVEAARFAPSWANTQCWEFILVKDPAVKEQLSTAMPEVNQARKVLVEAPVVVAMLGRRGLSGFYQGAAATDKDDTWYMYDLGLAAQNMSLAAHALGLGSVILGLFDAAKAERILDVSAGVSLVALMPLGYPEKTPASAPPRKPLCEFIFLNTYESPWATGDQDLCFIEEGNPVG
ncbi:MAG: nitroreductase family protein [Deltaproteobacteria bacterium]|nr:nitroreductase family protein [Candidatus Anaeroferrophillacea bacterium]